MAALMWTCYGSSSTKASGPHAAIEGEISRAGQWTRFCLMNLTMTLADTNP